MELRISIFEMVAEAKIYTDKITDSLCLVANIAHKLILHIIPVV